MLFQVVLTSVIVYLAACYAYGLVLLWKLYNDRRRLNLGDTAGTGVAFDGSASDSDTGVAASLPGPAAPAYHPPAKAA